MDFLDRPCVVVRSCRVDCCVEADFLIDAIIPIEIDVSDAGALVYVGSLHSSNIEFAFVIVDTQPIASPARVCPAICVCKGKDSVCISKQ